ncbi:MAG TPA: hypothetical protein VE377_07925 [Candidatus Dormibacteraeota bacterium]|nr:hypothetical protein [Candidatus Dormibacteraeota bacterium]
MKAAVRLFVICSLLAAGLCGFGQSTPDNQQPSTAPANAEVPPKAPVPIAKVDPVDNRYFGGGVKVSTLGVGAEVATRVLWRANLRAGFNVLGYSRTFDKDGISYDGHLAFKAVEAHFDFFPWAGNFHVGPGVIGYIGDPIKARATVPGNQNFSLGGVTYYSDPASPTNANGRIDFNQIAPIVTIGWGNLVPRRKSKRFSVPFEMGVAFQGSPKATLGLSGNVCTSPGVNCSNAANDPNVQSNVLAEQNKLNNSMSFFKVYPIISLGFGYKF